MKTQPIPNNQDILFYMLSGKAKFTIENLNTGNGFDFAIVKSKKGDVSFVQALYTETQGNPLGIIAWEKNKPVFRHNKKEQIPRRSTVARAFVWFFNRISNLGQHPLPDHVVFWHWGKCGCCGQKLSNQESLRTGIGPDCRKNIQKASQNGNGQQSQNGQNRQSKENRQAQRQPQANPKGYRPQNIPAQHQQGQAQGQRRGYHG